MKSIRVCVTGASGFIASWIVKILLQKGYTVNATVRNIEDSAKVDHLRALEGAEERLFLFQANLLEKGSFDAAVQDCQGVFHTASPVLFENISDPEKEIIEPAVEGTLNVLNSCAKVPSIKRVIFTSSMAAVLATKSISSIVDESCYSDPELCKETQQWYLLSKTLAEEAAFKFVQGKSFDVVSINPGLTIGPMLHPSINFSSDSFLSLILQGRGDAYGMPGGQFVFVDVRDIAHAHILAFEKSSAHGRYCLVQSVVTAFDTLKVVQHLYPNLLSHHPSLAPYQLEKPAFQVSNEKAKLLGVEFTSLETSVKDTIDDLLEKKLIHLN